MYANQSIDLDLSNITTDLTKEQQQADAAKYYHETPTEPSEKILSSLDTPLEEENIVTLDNFNVLLNPDYEFRNGYAVLENGIAYSATETVFDGVTQEIYDFYYAWAAAQEDEELIYKIWYPGYHYTTTTSGSQHVIVEDTGAGPETIIMGGGLSVDYDTDFASENGMNVQISSGAFSPVDGDGESFHAVLVHVKFINEDGYMVDRVVTYFGCTIKNGKLLPDETPLENPEERAIGMALHSAGENANLVTVMQEVYEDNSETFDASDYSGSSSGRNGTSKDGKAKMN